MRAAPRRILTSIMVLIVLLTGAAGWSAEASIEDIIITNDADFLLLYCTVQGSFSEDLNRAILKGVPTTFTYRIELLQKRSFLLDKKLASFTLNRTVKYDAVKTDFTVTYENESDSVFTVNEFFKAKALMSEINGLKLIRLSELEKDRTYYVRVKAELNKVRLPLYLHYVLYFVTLWDFETDWQEYFFTY